MVSKSRDGCSAKLIELEITIAAFVTHKSISLWVKISPSPKSVTVGTPTAITGSPKVFSLISFRQFPTPDPGFIPLLLI